MILWVKRRLRFGVGFSRYTPARCFIRRLSSQHSLVLYVSVFGAMLTVALSHYPPGYYPADG